MNMRGQDTHGKTAAAGFNLKPLTLSVRTALLPGLVLGLAPTLLQAAPTGGQVRAGNAGIAQNGATTTINQTSQRAAIDWQTYNVQRHETVRYNQPNARASTLNRIFDQNPSQIFGQVKANGQVVLMNPNGVFFKPGAQVDVGSLVAGAMQIGIDEFMSGNYRLQALKDSGGRVVNQGTINADAGDVALVGQSVANEGVIVATAGRVHLAAGEKVTVDFDGDGLLRFTVDEAVLENAQAIDDQVSNSGEIIADGGDVLITASAAEGVFRNAINNQGLVKAGRIENQGGRIMLVGMGAGASVLNTGQIDASAATATDSGGTIEVRGANVTNSGVLRADAVAGDGGSIHVEATDTTLSSGLVSAASESGAGGEVRLLGEQVGLTGAAQVDVSGGSGGGEALIGGGYQGANAEVRNAEHTYVGRDVSITADAGETGDGGTVVVWADQTTRYLGDISATGGSASGDGGDVEVSGKQDLMFDGSVDASAPNGETGTLLLDPNDLHIVDDGAGGPGTEDVGNPFDQSEIDNAEYFVEQDVLEALGAGVNLVLAADNDILFEITGAGLNLAQDNTGSVVFRAGNDIAMAGIDITTAGADVTLDAANNVTNMGTIDLGATGTLILDVAGTIVQNGGDTITGATSVDLQTGTLFLSESNDYTGTTTVGNGTELITTTADALADSASVTVNGTGQFNLNGTDQSIVALNGDGVVTNFDIADGSSVSNTLTITGNGGSFTGTLTDGTAQAVSSSDDTLSLTMDGANATDRQVLSATTGNFGGAVNVNAGTLSITTSASLGTVAGVTTTTVNGGTLELDGFALSSNETLELQGAGANGAGALSGEGTASIASGGTNTVTLLADASIGATSGSTLTISRAIGETGADALTKVDAGTVVLDAANTYTGGTVISAGTLQLDNSGAVGGGGGGNVVLDAASAVLVVNGGVTITETVEINTAGGTVRGGVTGGSDTATITDLVMTDDGSLATAEAADTLIVAGNVSGSGALASAGPGVVTLQGDNATAGYSGAITVSGGTLRVEHQGALGSSGTDVATDGTTVNDGAKLQFAIASSQTVSEDLSIQGDGPGTSEALEHTENNTLTLAGTIALPATAVVNVSNAGGSAAIDVTGAISGTGGLTKTGTGRLLLSNTANAYTGTTTISAGELAAGAATVFDGTDNVIVTGTLNLNGFDQDIAQLNGAGTVTNRELVDSGAVTSTLTLTGDGGVFTGTLTDGVAEAAGGGDDDVLSLTMNGASGETQTLSATTGDFSGDVTVLGGTLAVTTADSLGNGTGDTTIDNTADADATLDLQTADATSIGEAFVLTGAGATDPLLQYSTAAATTTLDGGVTLSSDGTIAVTQADGILIIDTLGVNDGGGANGLTKTGAGTLQLDIAATYTGGTTISGGVLKAGVGDAIASSVGVIIGASGEFDMNGTGQTLTQLSGSGVVDNNGAAATLTVDTTGAASTYTGAIDETGGQVSLTVSGDDVFTLGGTTKSYTGTTLVSGTATLAGGAADVIANSSDLNVGGTATFNLNGFDQDVAQLNGTGTVTNFDIADAGAVTNTLTVTGAGGSFTGTLTDGTAQGVSSSNDVLAITLDAASGETQTLGATTGNYSGDLSVLGGTLAVTTAASFGNTTGSTTVDNTADADATLDLQTGTAVVADDIELTGAATADPLLKFSSAASTTTLSGVLSLGSDGTVEITQADGTLAVTNAIVGTDTLTKLGAGTLQLDAQNNLAGGALSLDAGTLAIGQDDVLATDIDLTVNAGTTFNLNGNDQTVGSLSGAGTVTNFDIADAGAFTNTLTIAGDGGVFTGTLTDGTAQGVSSSNDVLAITMNGASGETQTLSATTGNFSGDVTVLGGTLAVTTADSLGNGTGDTTIDNTADADATLDLQTPNATSITEAFVLTGAGATDPLLQYSTAAATTTLDGGVTLSSDGTIAVTQADGVLVIDTVTIGDGGGANDLTKTGSGTLRLDVAAAYTGTTDVQGGELRLGAGGSLGAATTLNAGGSGTFNLNGQNQTLAQITGTGVITNDDGAGTTTSLLTVTGTSTFDGTLTDSTAGAGDDLLALTKSTGGVLTLSNGANAYGGQTNVSSGATLRVTDAGALGANAGGIGVDDTVVASGGTLEAAFAGNSNEQLSLAGSGVGGVGALNATAAGTQSGNITLTADTTIGVDDSTAGNIDFTVSGDITGAFGVTKVGPDTLVLNSAAKTYTGGTTISAGVVKAGVADVIAASVGVSIGASGEFDMNGTGQTLTQLSGSGVVDNNGAAATLTVDTTGAASTYTGAIDETGGQVSLTVSGDDVFTLGGSTKSYTGTTLVSGTATLAGGAADVIANSSDLNVGGTATFNLNGFDQDVAQLNGTGTVTNFDIADAGAVTNTLTVTGAGGSFTGTLTDGTAQGVSSSNDVLAITLDAASGETQTLGATTGNYSGDLSVLGGTLAVTTAVSFGNGTGDTTIDNTADADATLDLQTADATSIGEAFVLTGAGATDPLLQYSTAAATTTLDGGVTLSSDGTIAVTQADGILVIDTVTIGDGGGANDLTKTGSGTLRLDVAAAYTGTTDVQGGELRLGAGGSLVATTTLNAGGSGTFNLNGQNQTLAQITGTGVITNDDGVGTTTSLLTVTGTSTFDGTLTDSTAGAGDDLLALTKSTGGVLTLSNGANAYGGQTNVSSGATLRVTDAGALGTNAGGIGVDDTVVASGGTLEAAFAGNSNEQLSLAGSGVGGVGALNATAAGTQSGNITLTAGTTIGVDDSTAGNIDFTVSGDITGAFGVTKVGPDTLVLNSAAKSYTGATVVSAGTLRAGVADVIAASSGLTLNGSGVFDLGGFGQSLGSVNSASATSSITNSTGGTAILEVTGSGTFAGLLTESGSGVLALTKSTGGTFTISNDSSDFSGATLVSGGTLQASTNDDVIASSSGLTVNGTGVFDVNGTSQQVQSLDDASGTGEVTNSSGTGTIDINGGGSYTGVFTDGAGVLNVTKSEDATTLVISNTGNTYTGLTTISGGTLQADTGDDLISASSGVTLSGTGKFDLNDTDQSIGALNGTGGSVTNEGAGASLLTVNGGGSFAGDLTESGGTLALTKAGANTLTLSGSNDYSGATMVNVGKLATGSDTAIGDASDVTIANAAELELGGTSETVGTLSGVATGILDLGLSSLIADGDLDLSNLSVQIASAGSANQILEAGNGGAGTLTTDANLTKNSTGNLTLRGATNILIGGNVTVADGNIVIEDNFDLHGDLTASDDVDLSTVTGQIVGASGQTIEATAGTLSTAGLTANGANDGGLFLVAGTLIDITGLIDVDTAGDDLTITGDFQTTDNLEANGFISFTGTTGSFIDDGNLQSVTAGTGGSGGIVNPGGIELVKADGDLLLAAVSQIGTDPVRVKVDVNSANGGLRIEAGGGNAFIESDSELRIDRLAGAAGGDALSFNTTGSANLIFEGGDGYDATINDDNITFDVGGDVTFRTNALSVGNVIGSFGGDDAGHALNVDIGMTVAGFLTIDGGAGADAFNLNAAIVDGGASSSTFNGGDGNDSFDFAAGFTVDTVNGQGSTGTGDHFDLADYTDAITFNLSATGTGTMTTAPGGLSTAFTGIERLTGSTSNAGDTISGAAGASAQTFTITGANQGTTTLLGSSSDPSWQQIENIVGTTSGSDILAGSDDYVLTGLNQGTANGISGTWSAIENLQGTGGASDRLAGGDEYDIRGLDSGTTPNNNGAVGNRITGTWSGIANLEGDGSVAPDVFRVFNNGTTTTGELSGMIMDDGAGGTADVLSYANVTSGAIFVTLDTGANTASGSLIDGEAAGGIENIEIFIGGGSGADDTLTGRDIATTWTINGGANETLSDAVVATTTFSGFEILQGGDQVNPVLGTFDAGTGDHFDISNTVTFSEIRGGGGDDLIEINDATSGAGGSVVTADIFGEADDDTLNFGDPADFPAGVDRSRVAGDVNLGLELGEVDTIDLSGSELFQLVSATADANNEQSGTTRGSGPDLGPPRVDLISGTFDGVEDFIGNGKGTLIGPNTVTFWNITGSNAGTYGNSFANIAANSFTNFNVLAGSAADTVYFATAGGSDVELDGGAPGTPFLLTGFNGGGGVNTLVGSTLGDTFTITGARSVNYTNVDGGQTALENIDIIDSTGGGTVVDTGNDTFAFGTSTFSGSVNGGGGVDLITVTKATTATISAIGPTGMTSGVGGNNFALGGFTQIETLTTGTNVDNILVNVPMGATAGTGNTVNLGGGTALDTLRSSQDVTWVITGNGAGVLRDLPQNAAHGLNFTGVDNLLTTQDAALVMPTSAGTAASIAGTFTADSVDILTPSVFAGALGLRIDIVGTNPEVNRVNRTGSLTIDADGTGNIDIDGPLNVTGSLVSVVGTGDAIYRGTVTTGANQRYTGNTTFFDDVTGANLVFGSSVTQTVTIQNTVAMRSSTGVFDFNANVASPDTAVLSIVPPENSDIFIDDGNGSEPGTHIRSTAFNNFEGTLSIGGEFTPVAGGTLLDGEMTSPAGDYIRISEDFITGGNILLLGSAIEFAPRTGDLDIAAGGVGEGEFTFFAVGQDVAQPGSVLADNDGFAGGTDPGNIAAPTSNLVTFTGGSATLAASNEIINATNMIMNLGGGEVSVAQSDTAANQQVSFNVRSNATASNADITTRDLVISIAGLAGFANPANLFQNARVSFPNPAAVLTILQAVSFVDASLFEEDLSLFGVIGNGIAQSLDQCEDAEGCAPSVTEEELVALIESLNDRISRLEALLQAGEIDADDGARLLAGYRTQLQNFLDYQQDLAEYIARREADEFGDDLGDEFDDVFEAEESFDDDFGAPTEEEVAPEFEEAEEEPFEALETEPAATEPPAEFDELEEAFGPIEQAPPVQEAPAEPAPAAEPEFEELDEFDEFEELEEELDDALINQLLDPRAVNQLAGAVSLDRAGRVIWAGDLVLPVLHRRY